MSFFAVLAVFQYETYLAQLCRPYWDYFNNSNWVKEWGDSFLLCELTGRDPRYLGPTDLLIARLVSLCVTL